MATSTDGYALLKTITLPGTGGHGDWVTYDADTKTMWLAQSPDNNVVVIDTTTNAIKAVIPNIGNSNGIALTPQYAFVADVTNNTTDVIDKHTFQVVARVSQTGTTPDGIMYIPSTNEVAVASDDASVLDFLSASAPFTQTKSVPIPTSSVCSGGPDVGTYVPQKGYIYEPIDQQIDVIDPHTDATITTWNMPITGSVKPIVYDPISNEFLVGTTDQKLLVVDGDHGTVLKTIAIPGSVDQASIDVGARLAFFGDKAGVADIVNLDSNQLVGGLPAEKNMHTLGVDPTTHDVYVYENNRNTVDIFDRPDPNHAAYFGTSVHDATSPGGEVFALYHALLGRDPDPLGLEQHTAELQTGMSLFDLAQAFISSPEYKASHPAGESNTAFVQDLYHAALHRDAEPGGLQTWTNALDHGVSRGQVAAQIATSPEAQHVEQSSFSAGVFVPDQTASDIARLYFGVLDRAPDAFGLQGFTNAVEHGGTSVAQIAQGMLTSPEFTASHSGLSDSAFVNLLYADALDRTPDAGGLQTWTNALGHGASRADVAIGIAESTEAKLHLVGEIEAGWLLHT